MRFAPMIAVLHTMPVVYAASCPARKQTEE
jgi:hypothetical protein